MQMSRWIVVILVLGLASFAAAQDHGNPDSAPTPAADAQTVPEADDGAHDAEAVTDTDAAGQGDAAAEHEAVLADAAPVRPNPMHPAFRVLDAQGQDVRVSGKPISEAATCGSCHDVGYISAHSTHINDEVQVGCLACHAGNGELPTTPAAFDDNGLLRRQYISLHAPSPAHCGACHGVVETGMKPLTLPDAFAQVADGLHPYHLTRNTGTIISSQTMAYSHLNLEGKQAHDLPWDVHAARLVTCTACHYSPNNPERGALAKDAPSHLTRDPRHLSTAAYIRRPDHRLANVDCTLCHDPLKTHDFLPYKQRHFARLDCQTCHVPAVKAPVLQSEDATVILADGQPRAVWRNMDSDADTNLNARYITDFNPYFLPYEGPDGTKIHAANIVTRWFWTDGEGGKPVALTTVAEVFQLDDGGPMREARAIFDKNGDGRIQSEEWVLNDPSKIDWAKGRLKALGVANPVMASESVVHPIHHGVQANMSVVRECTTCHGADSRFSINPKLAETEHGMAVAQLVDENGKPNPLLTGTVKNAGDGVWYYRNKQTADYYLLGKDRAPWSDSLGFLFFVLSTLGVAGHAGFRIYTRRKRNGEHGHTRKAYMYTAYERLWHWLMAASILLLILTGFEIHYVSSFGLFGFANAVQIHNVLAVIMIVNAFLSFFYHLASTDIRQFIPRRETLFSDIIAQVRFYLNGIFVGAPHPTPKTVKRKLNPLQQLTYLMLLNVLIPFQVLTGILIVAVNHWAGLSDAIGGLSIVTPLHNLGSWLLLTFVVVHIYLTTTGHTLTSNISAMIDGYDEIDLPDEATESEVTA